MSDKICEICEKKFQSSNKNTILCSDQCKDSRKKEQNKAYYKRDKEDEGMEKIMREENRERQKDLREKKPQYFINYRKNNPGKKWRNKIFQKLRNWKKRNTTLLMTPPENLLEPVPPSLEKYCLVPESAKSLIPPLEIFSFSFLLQSLISFTQPFDQDLGEFWLIPRSPKSPLPLLKFHISLVSTEISNHFEDQLN